MRKYLQKRLLLAIPTMLLVFTAVFLMLYLIPGDPASIYLGENRATPERLAQIRHEMGLDRPIYIQYADYLSRGVRGDLGRSLVSNRPVSREIMERLPNTIQLGLSAMVLAMCFGITLGVLSGLHQNGWIDTLSSMISLAGVSMPIFWLGLLLIMLFAVHLRWLPATSPAGLHGLVLPALSLALVTTATTARLTRSSVLEVLRQEYLTTARAKGLRERVVVLKHTLPNALIPIVTVMGLQLGNLLSGSVITETVFARPGLGKLVVDSILSKDFPVVQGVVLVLAMIYITANLLVDLSYALIDPRIRFE